MKRQKGKKKNQAKERVFGCDLVIHLETSGQEVPQVLKSCSQFIEEHGIVDGIYRLSGISSNIQKLRQEFDTEKTADLTKDVYLQDIHCVSSLCKAYFRELPNPLLMYQLYDKFADAVNTQLEEDRLLKISSVLKDLPPSHYRTLEFLMRHLLRMASHSSKTNMHARNLAIVWAPNLLRSKEIESSGFNGTAAFMEVRVQSIVVEFILNHVEQLFDHKNLTPDPGVHSDDKRKSLASPSSAPNLVNEESGHRILASQIPHIVHMGDGPPAIRPYHSIIELPENRRKGSLKVKKWKSIFNLGKSGTDSKRKASRNDERDVKCDTRNLRPAKSMDSLSSVPFTEDGNSPGLDDHQSHRSPSDRRDSFGSIHFASPDRHTPAFSSLDPELLLDRGVMEAAVLRTGLDSPRSAKAARQRAEKRAAMHISGPFSVSLPEHVSSLLKATEQGAGSIRGPEDSQDQSSAEEQEDNDDEEEDEDDAPRELVAEVVQVEQKATEGHDTLQGLPINSEITLELQDTFSFLDTQDTSELGDGETDYPGELGMPLRTPEEMEPYDYYIQSCHERSGMLEMSIESELMDLELDGRELTAYDSQVQYEEFSVEPPVEEVWNLDDVYELTSERSGTQWDCPKEASCSGKERQDPELCGTDLRTPSPTSKCVQTRNVDCSTVVCIAGGENPREEISESGKVGCSTVACCTEQQDQSEGNAGCSTVACCAGQHDQSEVNRGCPTIACCTEQHDQSEGSAGHSTTACCIEQHDQRDGSSGCSTTACCTQQRDQRDGSSCCSTTACCTQQRDQRDGSSGCPTTACCTQQRDQTDGSSGCPTTAYCTEQHDQGEGSCGCSTEATFTEQVETDGEVGRRALAPSPAGLARSPGRIYQARSLPVVPPKPHYAKLPPALKGKRRPDSATHPDVKPRPPQQDHAHPADQGPTQPGERPRPSASGHAPAEDRPAHSIESQAPPRPRDRPRPAPAARAHAWRTAASLSFDEAVALARQQRSNAGGRAGSLQRGNSAPDTPYDLHNRLSLPHFPSEPERSAAGQAARCRSLVLEADEAP